MRALKVAAALLLTLRGTPFLYYGEEIGMRDIPIRSREDVLDPVGKTVLAADERPRRLPLANAVGCLARRRFYPRGRAALAAAASGRFPRAMSKPRPTIRSRCSISTAA